MKTSTNVSSESVDTLRESALAHEIEFLAVKASANGTRRANQLLKPLGLKVRSYSVLALACAETAPSQRMLAEFLDLDPSQIVALIDDLESRGFVRRVVDPQDRRSKAVAATKEGTQLYERAAKATRDAEKESLRTLSQHERETLRSLLRSLVFDSPGTEESAPPPS